MIIQNSNLAIQPQAYATPASGGQDGPQDRVSLYPPDKNCWVPVDLRKTGETISDAAQTAIDTVKNGDITKMVVARGIPQLDWHRPEAPGPFRSVDHHVTFESEGTSVTVNFTTGLGHLAPVTPGETKVPGSITLGEGGGQALNNKELDGLLTSLYSRYSGQMSQQDADTHQHLINTAASVRFKDGDAELVAAKHQEYSQAIRQPEICPEF